jgi:AcrR family transcriptional regulator
MAATTQRKTRSDGERSRQTILRAAANLATVDGLEGISIGTLAAHIGMSKSGLYAHFGSKEELQLATVDTAFGIFEAEILEPSASVTDPLERLQARYDAFLDHIERRVFPGGCFFASVTAEFDTHPGPVQDKIAAVQEGWSRGIEQLVAEAQAQGRIRADEDPAQLAFELDAYVLKGNTDFVLHDDAAYLRHARAAIARRLAHAS